MLVYSFLKHACLFLNRHEDAKFYIFALIAITLQETHNRYSFLIISGNKQDPLIRRRNISVKR